MNAEPIIVEKIINAPVARVWRAITDKKQMKEWYFDIAKFEAKKGFEFEFEAGAKSRKFTHVCKIIEVIENKKLEHTWTYKEQEGTSVVTWELTDMGGKTKVKLTHTGLESFPQDDDFRKSNFEKGWTSIVGTNLPRFAEKQD